VHRNKNNKFAMGTKGGWFLAAKSNLMGQPSVFVWPFLDALKLTKDAALTLKNALMDRQTTAEWEEFIFEAQEEWEEVEAHTLENIQEVGDNDVDNASDNQVEGDLVLSSPPSAFMWQEELNDVEGAIKAKLDDMNPKNAKEAVEELQAAFGDLEGMVVEARQGSHNNAMEVLTHVDTSMTEIIAAIDRINKQGRRWESKVGDVTVLRDDSGLPSLTIVNAVAKMAPLTTPHESSGDDLSSKLVALSDLIAAVDNDFSKTCTILNNKIKALERTRASAPLVLPALTLSTPVQDEHGVYVTTLGGILDENSSLKQSNVRLMRQMEKLSADVTAQ
jgi:hypothetical protein